MKNYRRRKILVLAVAAATWLLPDAHWSCAAQRNLPAPIAPEWSRLSTEIQKFVKDSCPDELGRAGSGVVETADVTADGIPEALVEYCRMGAYTSDYIVMQLENGAPVVAKFRDRSGKPKLVFGAFMRGASERNGEDVTLLPEKRTVYATHWHTDDSGVESCEIEAYVWSPRTKTFDENKKVSDELTKRNCREIGLKTDLLDHPR